LKRPLPVALVIAFAARAAPVLFGYEHYGDAPVRIELAERWAQAPHLWHGYLETYQYGPLHLTVVGGLVRLLGERVVAARLLSLVSGLVGVWLLYRVAERERGREAGFWAAFGLALSPLHVQASATGASEALFLALLLGALLLALRDHALLSALLLGAAGLVRYDGWMYVPLFGALLFARTRDVPRALGYCAIATAPALFWLWVNTRWTGDPFAPIHHIDREHAILAQMALASSGRLRTRLEGLLYWPCAICIVATPVLGLLGLWGSARAALRRESGWELVAIAWLPAAWFTLRAAALLDFRPMARFTLVAAALSLVFAHDALALLRGPVRAVAVGAAAATPLVLAALCWNRTGAAAEWARPLAPIGSLPPGIAEAARWLAANTAATDAILLDGSPYYLDITLAFAAGLPEERWIRVSWKEDFEQRLARHTPVFAVLIVRGPLGDFTRDRFDFRGLHFCAEQHYTYATVYRRCAPVLPALDAK
jgi:4-amino-4-deoxy-L-arabinose transferase-like glycosyltransferase